MRIETTLCGDGSRERETRVRGRERAFEESSEDEDGETDARRARFGSKERSVEGQVLSGELGAMREREGVLDG